MKKMLLVLFTINFCGVFAQATLIDSIQLANDSLDSHILKRINEYKENTIDFLILRTYDSDYPMFNQCRFIYRLDACTTMYGLHLTEDYSVGYVSVGRRIPAQQQNNCFDELDIIAKDLSNFENYFKLEDITYLNFKKQKFTLYGKIDGEYIYETFDDEFIEKHHPGMLHYVVCSYFGVNCQC